MDWMSSNHAESFKLFRQKLELYFKVKNIKKEDQVPYILLQVGDEGLRRYNAWSLSEDEVKDPKVVFDKFKEQLEPTENFRVCRLKLMYYRQKTDESLDDFVNRCKLLALKCDFSVVELDERVLELIIAGTPIIDFQKELLRKKKGFKLSEAITLGRTYEATVSSVKELKEMCTANEVISVIRKPRFSDMTTSYEGQGTVSAQSCYRCGRSHSFRNREACPAFGSRCNMCGSIGHWASVCKGKKDSYGLFHGHRSVEKRSKRNQKQGINESKSRYQGSEFKKMRSVNEIYEDTNQDENHVQNKEDNDFVCQSFESLNFSVVRVSNCVLII